MMQDAAYRHEILRWLLGRLEKRRMAGLISPQPPAKLPQTPIRSWWIFEGKRYQGLDGPLSVNLGGIDRQARRLLSSFSPVRRVVDSPEGETDWITSGFHTLTQGRPTYVCRASHAGLTGDERDTLLGWLEWIRSEWSSYVAAVGTPEGAPDSVPWQPRPSPSSYQDAPNLRRWAHTAKRSRWPLLRNITAESLRAVLEPQTLDQLPLPSQHETLFELLCLVRILREFEPNPAHIRWLDLETGRNEVRLPELTCSFQYSLGRANVLSTREFDPGLREAIEFYGLTVPNRVDGLLRFSDPRGGFYGILLEIKSGSQGPDTALYQLKCYRAALKKVLPQPLIIWAITELEWRESGGLLGGSDFPTATRDSAEADRWIFSTADQVSQTLLALGLMTRIDPVQVVSGDP